ncbi:hypothetical protein [Cohaesibacter haloalkalitolerans]|uniref:hypothetical protein n=1 Tax=Cohaesibacter haloalkalitolerans TaxID=1162980 RepID=UPI000E647F03|nr:hypothetical protein [Cohaesibacter haloalkalitolerans]
MLFLIDGKAVRRWLRSCLAGCEIEDALSDSRQMSIGRSPLEWGIQYQSLQVLMVMGEVGSVLTCLDSSFTL